LAKLITSIAVDNNALVMGIWGRGSHQFLGEVGLYSLDHERRVGEVGYWLRQRARGNGFIQEAVRTLATYATAHGVSRLEAHVAAENLSSRRVVERLGFDIAGHRTPAPRWDGEVGDVLIYALQDSRAASVSDQTSSRPST
jgi:RimJ/RimL family protein N-acetyltransferase